MNVLHSRCHELQIWCLLLTYLSALMMIRSPTLPFWIAPWVLPLPSEAAAFSVAAMSASGMLMPNITQARFITVGCINKLLLVEVLLNAQMRDINVFWLHGTKVFLSPTILLWRTNFPFLNFSNKYKNMTAFHRDLAQRGLIIVWEMVSFVNQQFSLHISSFKQYLCNSFKLEPCWLIFVISVWLSDTVYMFC